MLKQVISPPEEESSTTLSLGPDEEQRLAGGCDIKLEKGSFEIQSEDEGPVDIQCCDPEYSCLGNNRALGGLFVRNSSFVLKAQSQGCVITITRPPVRVHTWPGTGRPWRRF